VDKHMIYLKNEYSDCNLFWVPPLMPD